MISMLAAITAEPGSPPDPLAGLRDNAPIVEVPWPWWVWVAIGAVAIAIVALFTWIGLRLSRRSSRELPPTARQIALREIERLRGMAGTMEPYAFSVVVSDVLRTYVSGHYGLHATQQTSPEFLASIARSERFSDGDRGLLAVFLERCDLLKFARVDGKMNENEELLREAAAFVQGARA